MFRQQEQGPAVTAEPGPRPCPRGFGPPGHEDRFPTGDGHAVDHRAQIRVLPGVQGSGEADPFPVGCELRLAAVGLQRGEQPRLGDATPPPERRVVPGFLLGSRCRTPPGFQPGFLVEGGNLQEVDPPRTVPDVSDPVRLVFVSHDQPGILAFGGNAFEGSVTPLLGHSGHKRQLPGIPGPHELVHPQRGVGDDPGFPTLGGDDGELRSGIDTAPQEGHGMPVGAQLRSQVRGAPGQGSGTPPACRGNAPDSSYVVVHVEGGTARREDRLFTIRAEGRGRQGDQQVQVAWFHTPYRKASGLPGATRAQRTDGPGQLTDRNRHGARHGRPRGDTRGQDDADGGRGHQVLLAIHEGRLPRA